MSPADSKATCVKSHDSENGLRVGESPLSTLSSYSLFCVPRRLPQRFHRRRYRGYLHLLRGFAFTRPFARSHQFVRFTAQPRLLFARCYCSFSIAPLRQRRGAAAPRPHPILSLLKLNVLLFRVPPLGPCRIVSIPRLQLFLLRSVESVPWLPAAYFMLFSPVLYASHHCDFRFLPSIVYPWLGIMKE